MQIKIKFASDENILLPVYYNHIIQGFIYNNIDKDLAEFLHDKGYASNGRMFKLFTFSKILNKGRNEDGKLNFGKRMELIVSSPVYDFCKSIANSMLKNEELNVGGNNLKVEEINVLNNLIENDEIIINTLSGIVAYSTFYKADSRKFTYYFMPYEKDFSRIVTENLIKKYNAFYNANLNPDKGIEIIPLGEPKQMLVYYKGYIIKSAEGKFLIKGDKRLLQLGLDAGFGSKNSQGFGCVMLCP